MLAGLALQPAGRDHVVGLDVVTAGDGRGVADRGTDRPPAGPLAGDGGTRRDVGTGASRTRPAGRPRRTDPDRPRAPRHRRPLTERGRHPVRGLPTTCSTATPPRPPARSPSSRRRAGRRWSRCASSSACCATTTLATRHPDTDARRGRSPRLDRSLRAAGLWRRRRRRGIDRRLPAGIDMSAYRIVQEALTNVIKHGGPIARVTVRRDADTLRIDVHDDGAPTPRRGRLARCRWARPDRDARSAFSVFGGGLSAHPLPGSGFDVSATLPLTSPDGSESPTAPGASQRTVSTR